MADAVEGVAIIHMRGHIHREIMPGNLLVVGNPGGGPQRLKLADFALGGSQVEGGQVWRRMSCRGATARQRTFTRSGACCRPS